MKTRDRGRGERNGRENPRQRRRRGPSRTGKRGGRGKPSPGVGGRRDGVHVRPGDTRPSQRHFSQQFIVDYPRASPGESVSCSAVSDSVTPWTVACQAPLSRGFSRQEHWSGLPCPPPRDLPDPRTEPGSPASQADSYCLSPQGTHRTFLNVQESGATSGRRGMHNCCVVWT